MSWYNHFSDKKYETICFAELAVGEKFRMDLFDGKRRRRDIIMVKTGELTCREFKSGKERKFYRNSFEVSRFNQLTKQKRLNP